MSPNIIFILADDMGYGDLRANNPDSKIPTPHLDRLAAEGMRFTNAHAASSVCTPSRYSVLTGRYCWRSRLKRGIVWEWDEPLIEEGRKTVAQMLQDEGYHTACIGKWHLGFDWPTHDGSRPNDTLEFGRFTRDGSRYAMGKNIDLEGRVAGGPVDRGFDTYFGVDVPNFPPYTWFENDRLAPVPTTQKPDAMYGHPGPAVPGWNLEAMIPAFTQRAVDLIESRAGAENPFFLYFPLTSPHSPIVPNETFRGMSGAGNYGDFVCEVDWVVGEVIAALERAGIADDTVLIFTSDNGPETRTADDLGAYERIRESGHYSMHHFRGVKADAWEGGHREPFIARWPGVVPAGSTCGQLAILADFMATCAEITGATLQPGEAEDSVSFLPLLKGEDRPVRNYAIHHSSRGKFAVRKGNWVYIDAPSGGEKEEPEWYREERGYTPHDYPGELFNLDDDPGERRNRYAEEPELVKELSAVLTRVKAESHGEDAPQGVDREPLSE